jgi:Collagen triple helix repeat (20 copies)
LTVNGNSGISAGSGVATAVPVSTTDTFISMDATAAVQGWISTPGSNNGFMIIGNSTTSVQFDSKENTTTSHPATLTIVLASSGPTGPTGAASTVAGPTGPTGATGATGAAGAASATGATGPTGAAGTNGATGPTGAASTVAGPTGATGANGTNGATGPTGANGTNGATGPTGANGTNGATGPTGANGTNGATGPTGANGTNGTSGTNGATGPTGPAGSNGTGASPTGVPIAVAGHNGLSTFFSLTSSTASTAAAFGAGETVVAPTSCKPSITVWNYSGSTTTYSIFPVTGSSFAIGSTAIVQVTVANGGSASMTATGDVAAGTLMTLTSGTSNAGAAPGGNGFYTAFSCQ